MLGVKVTGRMAELLKAARSPSITSRYFSKVLQSEDDCWIWTGAISGRGHGRFWIADGFVVLAHRFGWLIDAGDQVVTMPENIRHRCDNPPCQNPAHFIEGTWASNRQDYLQRRGSPGSALNDVRGALGRARELRDAAKKDTATVNAVSAAGMSDLDRYQLPLW